MAEERVDPEMGEIEEIGEVVDGEIVEEPGETPTAVTLQDLRDGAFLVELGEALRECALAVAQYAGKGSVTAKLTFDAEGIDGVVVTDDIVSKIPRAAKPRTFRFVDKKGNLTDTHPDRLPLGPVREVPPAKNRGVRQI